MMIDGELVNSATIDTMIVLLKENPKKYSTTIDTMIELIRENPKKYSTEKEITDAAIEFLQKIK